MELDTLKEHISSSDLRAPEQGAESPGVGAGLLSDHVDPWEDGTLREDVGERWRPKDLDNFFRRIYEYFKERGYTCIVTARVLNILALAFIVSFSTFLFAFVNWDEVLMCNGQHCNTDKLIVEHPFATALDGNLYGLFVLSNTVVCCLFLVYNVMKCLYDIKEFYLIKCFINDKLGVTERDMCTIQWPELVDKIIQLQTDGVLIVNHRLTPLDIANRIMRRDNYFMAMINKNVIDLSIPIIPGLSETQILTKGMEMNLNYCIMSYMFDERTCSVRERFLAEPGALQKRFILFGVLNLVLSPFIFMFMIIYFFFKHAQQMHKDPSTMGTRHWSLLSKWKVREFNELEHFFDKRINGSFKPANDYILQFPSNHLAVIAKFVVFICGSFAGVLVVLSLVDESLLLYVKVLDRNLLWYIAIFGAVTAIARPFVVDKHAVFDPEESFAKVVEHTHYYPKRWRRRVHTYDVYEEFSALFPYKIVTFLFEVMSIFLVPIVMIFSLPKQANAIVQFVREFTESMSDERNLGDVCAFAAFDFETHGNSNYGAHVRRDKRYRSKQGKMEKSCATFKQNNPNWTPSEGTGGEQLLRNLNEQSELSRSMEMSQGAVAFPPKEPSTSGSLHSSMEDYYSRVTVTGPGGNDAV